MPEQRAAVADAPVPATPAPAALRVRSPRDLVEILPYLLGFHPAASLVVVALGPPTGQVLLTMRVDLADVRRDRGFPGALAAQLRRQGAAEVVVVVYGGSVQAGDRLPEWRLFLRLRDALADASIALRDALHVADGRLWSYVCVDPTCCPPDGHVVPPAGSGGSPLARAAAAAGLAALPDRQALERSLEPPGDAVEASLHRAVERAELGFVDAVSAAGGIAGWRAVMRRRLRTLVTGQADGEAGAPCDLDADEAARLLVALVDVPLRDVCWLALERMNPMPAPVLWTWLARHAPAPYDAPPLFLLAWSAWRRGDGALARVAVVRALDSDPGCHAATMLLQLLDSAVDPRRVPRLRQPAEPWSARTGGRRR